MADVQFQPQNPYALFSPDQWSNQFSRFNNAALPWPSSYAGMPTDAMGNPIQPPQGTTINSAPAPAPAPAAPANNQWAFNNALLNSLGQSALNQNIAKVQSGQPGWAQPASTGPSVSDVIRMRGMLGPNPNAAQAAQPPTPAASQSPGAPSYSQILSLLANPGKVTTPGATVPASATSGQPAPGGLQAFLANWRPAQSGPGSGFQQSFASALKGMGY